MSAPPEGEQYDSYVGRIARGASISSVGVGIGRLLGYATQLMLARAFGAAQLGFYILGITLVQITSFLARFGMDNGLVRYVAYHQAEGDVPRVRGTILLALWVTLGLSLALSSLLFFGSSFLTDVFAEEASAKPFIETIFKAFSLSIPFYTVMVVALLATRGFQTVKYITLVEQIMRPLINLGLVVVFYYLGAQVLGAVAAYVLSMVVGLVLALYCLLRIFPELLIRDISPKFESRALLSASGPMVVYSFAPFIHTWIAVGVLGVFTSAKVVGTYNVAARTAALTSLALLAFSQIFVPMISSLYGRGLLNDLSLLYKDVSRWVFTGGLAIFLLVVLLATDVLSVFGDEFIYGWPVLVVIAGAELFNCSVGPTDRMLAMTGRHNIVVLATIGAAIVAFAASVALVPLYGMLGAAIAAAGGIVLKNVPTLAAIRRAMNFWPYSRLYLKPLIAGLLTAAAMLLVRLVAPLPDGLLAIIILGPCLLTIFVVANLALGLSSSDQQLLKAFWTAVRAIGRGRV